MTLAATVPQQIGRYRVVSQLGSGAMGTVYLAVQEPIARQVAIKVLHASLSQDARAARRFLNEARAVNIVSHPALVQISDFGQLDTGRPYLVMEYLTGDTLRGYLAKRGGKLPVSEAIGLCADLADALAAAHHKRVVHRDLKPENVMLVPDQAVARGLRVKILDFGIAKMGQSPLTSMDGGEPTQAGALLGTPAYMAPEQISDAGVSTDRADVYALGIMTYEMLSGRVPFTGPPFSVMTQHVQAAPAPLRSLEPDVPLPLAGLIHAMLAKDPTVRPAMGKVAQDLAVALNPGAARRGVGRWAALGSLLCVVLGVAGYRVSQRRQEQPLEGSRRVSLPAPCAHGVLCSQAPSGFTRRLRSVRGAAQNALWAVGDQGTVMRGDGTTWTALPGAGPHKLAALWVDDANDVWAAGSEGILLHGRAGVFQAVPVPTRAFLTGLWRGRSGDLWISTKDGGVLRGDGVTFRELTTGTRQVLYALCGVAGPKGDQVFTVGRDGLLVRCSGGACEEMISGTPQTLHAVQCAPGAGGETSVWLAGKSGTLVRHDGHDKTAGVSIPTGVEVDLNALWLAPDGVLWVAGDQGTVLRVQHGNVTTVPAGVTEDLDSVWGDSAGDLWLVGNSGVILHRAP